MPVPALNDASLSRIQSRGYAGFTLIELMIVVVVIGILAVIAIPSYQNYVLKARRADAHEALMRVRIEQEKWRSFRTQYTKDLGTSGLRVGTVSSAGHYDLAVSGETATGFTATATAKATSPQSKDSGCTVLTLVVANGAETRSPAGCW